MIVVKYEQDGQVTNLLVITNDGRGTARRGDYTVGVDSSRLKGWPAGHLGAASDDQRRVALALSAGPQGRVRNYPRQAYSVWALVARSIESVRYRLDTKRPSPGQVSTIRIELWPHGRAQLASEIGRLVLKHGADACDAEFMRRGTTDRVQRTARFKVAGGVLAGGWQLVHAAAQAAKFAGAR